jgi:hypothetical protein
MKIKIPIFICILICFTFCCPPNFIKVKHIIKNFPKEYTGLDTLIRIDGYYYSEDTLEIAYTDSMGVEVERFLFSKNGKFVSPGYYRTHEEVQNYINYDKLNKLKGSYSINGDTIQTKWIMCYDWGYYYIFTEKYIILNDTTLKSVGRSIEYPCHKKEIEKNKVYNFYEYKSDIE